MKHHQNAHWPGLLILFTLLGLSLYYHGLSHYFPYDFIWDMDATTVQDVLFYNTGQYPTHNDHPKFAMVLILSWCSQIVACFGSLSGINLHALQQAPQPFFMLAELTEFLKSTQAFFTLIFIGLMGMLSWKNFPRLRWLTPLVILTLGLQTGTVYMALTTRSELFSAFIIALALLPALAMGRSKERLSLLFGLSGLGFGLALLTKIQALPLFFVIISFFGYQWSRHLEEETSTEGLQAPLTQGKWLWAGSTLLMILLGLISARLDPIPGRVNPILKYVSLSQFLSPGNLKLQIFWIGFLGLGLAGIYLSQLQQRFKKLSLPPSWIYFAQRFNFFIAGTVCAFLIPVFSFIGLTPNIGEAINKGLHYTGTLLRTTLLLNSHFLNNGGNNSNEIFAFLWDYRWDYLLLNFAMIGLLVWSLKKTPAHQRSSQLWCLALCFSTLGLLIIGNRPLLRDTFWFEVWIFWSAAWALQHLLQRFHEHRRYLWPLAGLSLLLTTGISVKNVSAAQEAFYLHSSDYGGDSNPYDYYWAETVYVREKNDYAKAMRKAYQFNPQLLNKSMVQARQWKQIKHTIAPQFPNSSVSLNQVSTLSQGFALWRTPQDWVRVHTIAPDLEGLPVIPAHQIEPPEQAHYYAMHYTQNQGYQNRFQGSKAPYFDVISPFYNQTFIAVSRVDILELFPKAQFGSPPALRVKDAQENIIDYEVFDLTKLHRFHQDTLRQLRAPVLFIFREEHLSPLTYPEWPMALEKRLLPDKADS